MNKKISVGVSTAIAFIAVALTFTATMIFAMRLFDQKVLSVKERASMYDKLSEIDTVVRQNYYYSINDEELVNSMCGGYISGMNDDDTAYLTASEVAERQNEMKGTVVTTGLETKENAGGYMQVVRVRSGSSASELGMQADDIITALDGESMLSLGYDKALEKLSGVEGTKLLVTYKRGEDDEVTVELQQESLEIQSVLGFMNESQMYYISIDEFNAYTPSQFEYEVNSAFSKNATGIIIDVRDAFGGYDPKVVANMADILLPAGTTVSAQYMNNETKVLYTSDENEIKVPLVIIINSNTTGLAELFAGVLRDSAALCRTVGTVTAGKGMLQTLVQLSDGSGIDLTVAKLLTPKGSSFDGTGIDPDFETSASEEFTYEYPPDELVDAQYNKAIAIMESLVR